MGFRRLLVLGAIVASLVAGEAYMSGTVARQATPELIDGGRATLLAGLQSAGTAVARGPAPLAGGNFSLTVGSGFTSFAGAQAAMTDATRNIWGRQVYSPVQILVEADFAPLPAGVLVSAGPAKLVRGFSNAPSTDSWYPVALANRFAGSDLAPGVPDIVITFNSSIPAWYFGSDGATPANQYDFTTAAVHAIALGLGFNATMDGTAGTGSWGVSNSAAIYERFAVNASAQSLLDTALFPNPSTALGAQLTGDNVFWNGQGSRAANSGSRPKLWAPGSWQTGSSLVHLDETPYAAGTADSLMTPVLNTGESNHWPGRIARAMLTDMGWDVGCAYRVSPASVDVGLAGGTFEVQVSGTYFGCAWQAETQATFLTLSNQTGISFSSNLTVTIAPAASARQGTVSIMGQTVTVRQQDPAPTLAFEPSTIYYRRWIRSDGSSRQTGPQYVNLRISNGITPWTFSKVSGTCGAAPAGPSSGIGGQLLRINSGWSVDASETCTFRATSATTGQSAELVVHWEYLTTTEPPFGHIDTPAAGNPTVSGAIPVTGWALDDILVTDVWILRAPVSGDPPGAVVNGRVFISNAAFLPGARPDIVTAFPAAPQRYRAGWGAMVLTNMLPSGNGTFTLYAEARDVDGKSTIIGERQITVDNANAAKPFGTLDRPFEGEEVSIASFPNYGWALTPVGRDISIDGSTMWVFINGVPVAHPVYNQCRNPTRAANGDCQDDIATLFPGRFNVSGGRGAIGSYVIDVRALGNGTHTIAWSVTDTQGATEGIGSRFFNVTGMSSARLAETRPLRSWEDVARLPVGYAAIAALRGYDPVGRPTSPAGGVVASITATAGERLQLQVPTVEGARYEGYLRTPAGLVPLPAGSSFSTVTGRFAWQPPVAYSGNYDLVFVRTAAGRAERIPVRVTLGSE